jgi:hypothetical protein
VAAIYGRGTRVDLSETGKTRGIGAEVEAGWGTSV